jgi:DNA primase large subunit
MVGFYPTIYGKRPLFFVRRSATVFLVDIMACTDRYVHLFLTVYMKFVEPVRDKKKIAQIINLLRGHVIGPTTIREGKSRKRFERQSVLS